MLTNAMEELNPHQVIEYQAEPTVAKFHASPAFVRGLMGPIGSGKSVGCLQEIIRLATLQERQFDGIRRSRWAVIRNTFPELKTTTIATFKDWYDPISHIKYDSPIVATMRFNDVHLEIIFIALDKEKDVKKLKSLELTGCWINEASEVPLSVIEMATGRVGRYPAKREGGPTRSCVIMDTNPPDDDHWWYTMFEEEIPRNYAIFKQPPALLKLSGPSGPVYIPNPEAENVKHQPLGYNYWLQQIPGKKEEWIKVFVQGYYGTSSDGRPCYPFYNDHVHCASEPLKPYFGVPLLLGWDYGRTPACIIGQVSPKGQFRILDEIVVEHDGHGMGIRKFTAEVVRPYLHTHYPGIAEVNSWGDPAGAARSQKVEENCFDIQAAEGIPTEPASTNDVALRLDNVEYFLSRTVGGEPAFLMSPTCRVLRKGFLGGYQFERLQVVGDARYKDRPKKNRYSHPHDGLQYLADLARNGVVKATTRARAHEVATGISPAGWT